jgi:hypothetical protein
VKSAGGSAIMWIRKTQTAKHLSKIYRVIQIKRLITRIVPEPRRSQSIRRSCPSQSAAGIDPEFICREGVFRWAEVATQQCQDFLVKICSLCSFGSDIVPIGKHMKKNCDLVHQLADKNRASFF